MTDDDERTARITIRVSPIEVTMLQELAKAAGLSSADIVRTMIRHAHAEAFGTPKKKR